MGHEIISDESREREKRNEIVWGDDLFTEVEKNRPEMRGYF